MAFPVKAEVKVDLPEPELPTNMVVLINHKVHIYIYYANKHKIKLPIRV